MLLYNRKVDFLSFDDSQSGDIKVWEDSSINPLSFDYLIEFENNQDREIELCSDMELTARRIGQKYIFTVVNVVSFAWENSKNDISYRLYKHGTPKLLKYWFSHIVFPVYLTLEKCYHILHGGAVVIEDVPVVFMASSHGGRSTLTDYFLQKGHALITDDKLGTYKKDDKFYCVSSYPFHRPYRDIETLGVLVDNFDTQIRLLKNIYVLEKLDEKADIQIIKLTGIEKFRQLRYGSEIDFSFLFEKGVKYILQLLNQIDIYKITIPWDLNRLGQVYGAIIEHQKNLQKNSNDE